MRRQSIILVLACLSLFVLLSISCTSNNNSTPTNDAVSNQATSTNETAKEPAPPPLNITAPADNSIVNTADIMIVGNTIAGASVKLNSADVAINPDGTFSLPVTLKEGYNLITVSARSSEGGLELKQVRITYTIPPPPPPPPPEPVKTYETPATSYEYTASVHQDPFHYSSCYWAGQIHDENRQWFSSRDEAIAAGHRPCKVCNP